MVFFLLPELTLCGERERGRVFLRDRAVAPPWDGELVLGVSLEGDGGEVAFGLAGGTGCWAAFVHPGKPVAPIQLISLSFPISFAPPGRTKPYRT